MLHLGALRVFAPASVIDGRVLRPPLDLLRLVPRGPTSPGRRAQEAEGSRTS